MSKVLFKIGAYDATKHILVPSYKVNCSGTFNQWVDGWGKVHRDVFADKLSGSFKMLFYSELDYTNFLNAMALQKKAGDYYTVQLFANNRQVLKSVEAFIDFDPTIRRDDDRQRYEPMTVKVEERYD